MVKKYSDLYLQARRALLPSEGENASMAARELLAFASGKSVTAVLADSNLYASEQIEEKLSNYVNRMLAHEPLPYILGQWDFYGISLESRRMCSSRATTPWLSPTLRLMFCAAGKHRACWIFAAAAAVSASPSRTSCRMPM